VTGTSSVAPDPSGTEKTGSSTERNPGENQPERGTVADHLRWLKEAGFHDVEFHFQEGYQALVGGYRSR
jgi:hypothetical protein